MQGIPEGNVAGVSPPGRSIPQSGENSRSNQDVPRICPLCSSKVDYFAINFHETFLMCENTNCEFPFGHEELQFAKMSGSESDDDIMDDNVSVISTASSSVQFTTGMTDMDRLSMCSPHPASKTDDQISHLEAKLMGMPKKLSGKIQSNKKQQIQKKKMLEDLKDLAAELNDVTSSKKTIRNEKYIKNLMHLQDHSGLKLLKPEEMKKLNKMEKVKSNLKIDVELGDGSCMSSIKIDIGGSEVADKSDNK